MGNAIALKIKNINQNNILKEILFDNDKKILEYVYYITKINKFYVQNFRKNSSIKEFTISNILTKKEFNIVIERVESGLFFQGLEYIVKEMPLMNKVILITQVVENSPSHFNNIESNFTLLLGNTNKYFSSISDIEKDILDKKATFIFYNFVKEEVREINFDLYRNKDTGQLALVLNAKKNF